MKKTKKQSHKQTMSNFIISHASPSTTAKEITQAFEDTFNIIVAVQVSSVKEGIYGRYRTVNIQSVNSSPLFNRFVSNIKRDGYDVFTANRTDYRVTFADRAPPVTASFKPRII
jgi:hypothetical protein